MQRKVWQRSALQMGTMVNMKVVTSKSARSVDRALTEAFELVSRVERICSRFDQDSELNQLCQVVDIPVHVSDILFETARFATEMADQTNGLFDPTIGNLLQNLGFDRHYLTGEKLPNQISHSDSTPSYRDLLFDVDARTIELKRPLQLDLGAVAKGFAVDLAAKALRQFEGFVIDAGGDVYVHGLNEEDEPWRVGIRHPKQHEEMITVLSLTDAAICTSGGYERPSPKAANVHHIIDPKSGASPLCILSATVVAPYAMMADASATAAFLMGYDEALPWLANLGMHGLLVGDSLELYATEGFDAYLDRSLRPDSPTFS